MDTDLTQLISNLLSSSLEKQLEGESRFNMMREKDPTSLSLCLSKLIGSSNSHDIAFQELCAFLLYKLLTDDECRVWKDISSVSAKSTIKSILLARIRFGNYSKYVCRTVSTLCNNVSNDWPELLPLLQECVASDSNRLKESFFFIYAKLSKDICRTFIPDIVILDSVFVNALNDDTLHLYTRTAALSVVIKYFILCQYGLNEMKRCHRLLPAMMKTLTDALSHDDQDVAAQFVLEQLYYLAEYEPRFFKTELVDVVNIMLDIAGTMILEEKTRIVALVFISTLVQAREKAPGMMKNLMLFTNCYFALLLNLLLDIKDVGEETDLYRCGMGCLVQLSNALGGKTVAHIAIEQLCAYLVSPDWVRRHAAHLALVCIAPGCSKSKVMIKYLKQVVNMVLRSFQDPHPRVRLAAIRSISHLSTFFSPYFQEWHHNKVVPALVAAIDDSRNPQVQELAATALSNFCTGKMPDIWLPYLDGISETSAPNLDGISEIMLPYLDEILNKLLILLQTDNKMVQQVAVDALTSLAEVSKEHFQKYYDFVMPYLNIILVSTMDESNHMLQSKALWCMAVVGEAAGRQKFRDDIKVIEVLQYLSEESQVKEYITNLQILLAWQRICKCMGKDFIPYMSTVMPLLVKYAQLEPDDTIDALDNSSRKSLLGDTRIHIEESHFLALKSLACGLFGSYAFILEEDFYPWISQATSVLVPLLKFYIHNNVRKSASNAMHCLLKSAKLALVKGNGQGGNKSYFKQLSSNIILALGDALYSEPETEVCATILLALRACVMICGPLLNKDLLRSITDVIKHVTTESSHRKEEFTERAKGEDFDAEDAELLRDEIEQEEKVHRMVGGILVRLLETFNDAFLPFLDELSSYLMPTRGKNRTTEERNTSIVVFDKLVVECSEAALKYYNIYLPFLLESSNDENPVVRQNALGGLGVCAEYGASAFKPFVGEALPRINVVITHLHDRKPMDTDAYNIAVYALGKICQFHRESINSMQIIPVWLNCLPIKGDCRNEIKVVHDQLCSMVKRSDRELLGPKHEHFPKIFSVIAEVLCAGKDLATTETTKRMIDVVWHLKKTIPSPTWELGWSLLLPQQVTELESILSP